jgi:hypothetical protein
MTTADTQALLADLSARLGPDRVIVDPAQLITYEVDGSFDRGHPDGVVFPVRSTRLCNWCVGLPGIRYRSSRADREPVWQAAPSLNMAAWWCNSG